MSQEGLILCSKYASPPNSLSLCGPEKQSELRWYRNSGLIDKGIIEILSGFGTMYPYLKLIASSNNIKDPFDKRVVEAYWIGNRLLSNIQINNYISHLQENLQLDKKLPKNSFRTLTSHLSQGILPNHAYHVLSIWLRTGNIDENHTIETMNACIINFGIVEKTLPAEIVIRTRPLKKINDLIDLGEEKLIHIAVNDMNNLNKINLNDIITFHWGMFVEKISIAKKNRLQKYLSAAINLANLNLKSNDKKQYIYHR